MDELSPFLDNSKEEAEVTYYKQRLIEQIKKQRPDIAQNVIDRIVKMKVNLRRPSEDAMTRRTAAPDENGSYVVKPGESEGSVYLNPGRAPDVGMDQDEGALKYQKTLNTLLHESNHGRGQMTHDETDPIMAEEVGLRSTEQLKKDRARHINKFMKEKYQ